MDSGLDVVIRIPSGLQTVQASEPDGTVGGKQEGDQVQPRLRLRPELRGYCAAVLFNCGEVYSGCANGIEETFR